VPARTVAVFLVNRRQEGVRFFITALGDPRVKGASIS